MLRIKPSLLVIISSLMLSIAAAEEATTPVANPRSLKVEIAIGTSVEDRKLVGEADSFPADTQQLVGWTKIVGAKEPTEIRHVWKCDGRELSSVPLSVQSSSFRTHSRKNVFGQKGTWSLEVRDADGNVLGTKSVEVK